MEKRLLAAIVLSLVVLVSWQVFFMPEPVKTPPEREVSSSDIPSVMGSTNSDDYVDTPVLPTEIPMDQDADLSPESGTSEPIAEETPIPEMKTFTVETRHYIAKLSSEGAHIISWQLRNYQGSAGEPLEMISSDHPHFFPGDIRIGNSDAFNSTIFSTKTTLDYFALNSSIPKKTIHFTAIGPNQLEITKSFTFYHDRIYTDLFISAYNPTTQPAGGPISVVLPEKILEPMDNGSTNRFAISGPLIMADGKRERIKPKKYDNRWVYPNPVEWVSIVENFFFMSLTPTTGNGRAFIEPVGKKPDSDKTDTVAPGFVFGTGPLAPNERVKSVYHMTLAPKKYSLLEEQGIGIESIVDFGWITSLGKLFYKILISTNKVVNNYGIAIIIFTIGIKILLLPLSHISMKSMKKMQTIQPQLKEVQERYRKDPKKQQEMLSKLYKQHGVNPMAGCLPMIIQLPVFIALYQVLLNSIELRNTPFLWADDLSAPDPFLVLIMGASMLIQQKMSPSSGDPRQAKMMMFMPILFTAMFWNFPSGLVLYWLMNNLLTIAQQYIMNKGSEDSDDDEPRLKARTRRMLEEKQKIDQTHDVNKGN